MNKTMVRYGVATIACVALAGGAHAQIRDLGVHEARDEFTGAYTCSQAIFSDRSVPNRPTIAMQAGEDDHVLIIISRGFERTDWTFNSLSRTPGDNDRVFFRFVDDDEVVSLRPSSVSVSTSSRMESASLWDRDLAARILSATGDIRVRFSGPKGNRDFTISHEATTALAEGFGQICWE